MYGVPFVSTVAGSFNCSLRVAGRAEPCPEESEGHGRIDHLPTYLGTL